MTRCFPNEQAGESPEFVTIADDVDAQL